MDDGLCSRGNTGRRASAFNDNTSGDSGHSPKADSGNHCNTDLRPDSDAD